MQNCRMKTEMERERNTRRTLITKTRHHLIMNEIDRNGHVVMVDKEI